ncbi:MAG: hypothetical protein ACKOB5_16330, partial [Betaproteobacteria bacterium]
MNPVSDNLLSSLSGAVPKAGLAAAAGLSDGQDATGQPPGDGSAQGGFAAVLGRVQAAGGVEAAPVTPGQGADVNPEAGEAALAGALGGAPVGGRSDNAGRQELAAGLSLQWAALLRGDAGVKSAEGGVAQHAVHTLQGPAGGDGGPQSPTVDSPNTVVNPGVVSPLSDNVERQVSRKAAQAPEAALINPGVVSALSDNVERQVSGKAAQAPEAALVGRLGLDSAGHRAVLDVALQALPPAINADGEGAIVEGAAPPGTPHEVMSLDDKAGTPLMPVPALVTWHLSPQLEVITASQPAASDESLRAFAAAQGFDAQALSRMFG